MDTFTKTSASSRHTYTTQTNMDPLQKKIITMINCCDEYNKGWGMRAVSGLVISWLPRVNQMRLVASYEHFPIPLVHAKVVISILSIYHANALYIMCLTPNYI
jgi:hypothetical protein